MDAAEYIREVVTRLPARTFVYFDRPYYVKGEGLYENSYKDDDHAEIAQLVHQVEQPWIVSYDAAPEIFAMYERFERISNDLSYSAADRYRGSEVMFFSPQLALPPVESPANIYADIVDKMRTAGMSLF